MVKSCAAFGCTNRGDTPLPSASELKRFHRFPSEVQLRKKWVQALHRQKFTPSDSSRVCSDHFKSEDYKAHTTLPRLKDTAVASVFKAFPAHLQPTHHDEDEGVAPKRRRLLVEKLQKIREQLGPDELAELVQHDHNYSFPSSLEEAKLKCDTLQTLLKEKMAAENTQKRKVKAAVAQVGEKDNQLSHALELLKNEKLVSSEGISLMEERFSGFTESQIKVARTMLNKKGTKGVAFSPEMKDFAVTLFYYSPKAYDFVAKMFTLPAPRSIRRYVGAIDCHPGFQTAAFDYLQSHKGDINYSEASLCIDGMSIKQLIQFDPKLGKTFGYVDIGSNCNMGEEVAANEGLVVMAVGLRSYWKLPLAWFLIKGLPADVLGGVIRESLNQCFEAGITIRTVAMDGTIHNISAFNKLGCTLQPPDISSLSTRFDHPHPDATYSVFAVPDPPHMAKNVRNLLAEYKDLVWPGVGTVRWSLVTKLQDIQEEHGLRLGNKLTAKHTHFQKNKMKVNLAVQVMSDSVSRSLKWAHANGINGFDNQGDIEATSRFLELHDKLFDICNSRSRYAFGLKAALCPENIAQAEVVFAAFINMYEVLERSDGLKIINSRRRTGPLGFIACIFTLRELVKLMASGEFKMEYLRCHKLQQDHLERFFSAIRQRNGWSYNPTPLQFMYAFRKLLCHAGKDIIHSATGNCDAQDETVMLTLSNIQAGRKQFATSGDASEESGDTTAAAQSVLDENNNEVSERTVHVKGCVAQNCDVCASSISYIAGYYVFSLQKAVKCQACRSALVHSEQDQCKNASLIYFKDYRQDTIEKGLKVPSGSLCKLLFLCETVFRKYAMSMSTIDIEKKLLIDVLTEMNMSAIFPTLTSHALETSDGIDNHYLTLIHLICRKYLRLRVKKVLRDSCAKKSLGNAIHRARIFKNL
jgi:hypothetical protein